MILQGFDARKQKTKAKKKIPALPTVYSRQSWAKKPQDRVFADCNGRQSAKRSNLCRLQLRKQSAKNISKKNIFFLCRLPSWRPVGKQFLKKKFFADCRGTSSRQSLPSGLTAPRGYADCWRGSWQRLCRLCATWQSANPPLPTQALPTALCRLPRGFAVGKAFADWVYAFADRGKQSAKRRFPVVNRPFILMRDGTTKTHGRGGVRTAST